VAAAPHVAFSREGALLRVDLGGRWTLGALTPAVDALAREMEPDPPARLSFSSGSLASWDSSLVAFVHAIAGLARARDVAVDLDGLPPGVRRLLALAGAARAAVRPLEEYDDALTARVGRTVLRSWATINGALAFVGEVAVAAVHLLRGRSRVRRADLLHAFEATGVTALGIVAFINFLIGAVIAFVGSVQLQQFGATLYVASLVAIAVTRELGALMTGMVMAGRTGAAFAALLGTMAVNEELDALSTMGVRPVDFLVLPRVIATVCMLPMLVAYADVLGLLGGFFVGSFVLGLGTSEYLRQTESALAMRHIYIGLVKGALFGLVVSLTGCYYGLRAGRSAAAVGDATTRAVVAGVVMVVVVDAAVTVLLHFVKL
jgi:phospholipid/cholesterol/gamma-HCH transport system permease protein